MLESLFFSPTAGFLYDDEGMQKCLMHRFSVFFFISVNCSKYSKYFKVLECFKAGSLLMTGKLY